MSRYIAKNEGLLVGISSGANLYACVEIAKKNRNTNKKIVTVLCDTGERYLSSKLF
jgi:cysteine synthase A